MQFQAPITIVDALQKIDAGKYLIPVIQREFVWKTKQIERLFDSLLREYPIGAFLFWEVERDTLAKYPFYEFTSNVVQGGDNHRKKSKSGLENATAILDGQQRLTAFLVGLTGSYASASKSNPGQQRLYLEILHYNTEAGEEDLAYNFKFLTEEKLAAAQGPGLHWFLVSDILKMPNAVAAHKYLQDRDLISVDGAFERLEKLRVSVQTTEVINFYLEKRDDLGEVLNVFVRLNRGGKTLSYPDLLLSAATVGWKKHDAQTEFKDCVRQMNEHGFHFTHDRVLKAGMVLAQLDDIKFKAANFKKDNALKIEAQWPQVKKSLTIAAALLQDFGLDEQTLTAENAIIPVAYYLKLSGRTDLYRKSMTWQEDRANLRKFVLLTLLKSGFWTGAVDQILTTIRTVIDSKGTAAFPLADILTSLSKIGKPLDFTEAEITGLLNAKYKQRNTTLILSLLYPVSLTDPNHQDHIVPRARLVESRLKQLKIPQREIALALDRRDRLPNLQLLHGRLNLEKSAKPITEFVSKITPATKRQYYVDLHDLGKLPKDEREFNRFYLARERAMKARLKKILTS